MASRSILGDPYTGVTGFMTEKEVAAACRVAREEGERPLMVGVLMSEKTLRGQTNRWPLRYPAPERIRDLLGGSTIGGAINLIHYYSSSAPSWDTIAEIRELCGGRLHGFQFNGEWPTHETLRRLEDAFLSVEGHFPRIVLQVRPGYPQHESERRAYSHSASDVLLDGSGGRGQPMDVNWVNSAHELLRHVIPCMKIGFAGGLDANVLRAAGSSLARRLLRLGCSVDAEGRLRDEAPGGGTMNMDKVADWIRAVSTIAKGGA